MENNHLALRCFAGIIWLRLIRAYTSIISRKGVRINETAGKALEKAVL